MNNTSWSHLHFYAGQTLQTVTVSAEDDDLNDDGESLTFYLGEMPAGYAVLVNRKSAKVNIEDTDDPNSVQVSFRSGNYYASEDGGPARVRVVMQPVPDRAITVPITFTRVGATPADHTSFTTSVTFEPEEQRYHNVPLYRDIEIWAIDDSVDDDGEYLDITFGNISDPYTSERTGNHRGGSRLEGMVRPANQTRVWFQDNEFTEVSVTNPSPDLDASRRFLTVTFSTDTYSAYEGEKYKYSDHERAHEGEDRAGEATTVHVYLDRAFDREREVTIPINMERKDGASSTDTIHTQVPSSITFKPGQTVQTFRVAARDDSVDDDGEWLQLGFGTLPERVSAGDHATARVNLVDDDHPAVKVSFGDAAYKVTSIQRDGRFVYGAVDVTVNLSAAPERFVDMEIVAKSTQGDGDVYFSYAAYVRRASAGGAAFDADDTEFTLTVVVSAVDAFDPGQTYRLSFGDLPDRVSAGTPATATVTVNVSP